MFRSPVEVRPGRMQHLARLPVFLGLKDRRVIIVGGSAAAAWKLELVAATGASIMAITADPSPEFLTVLAELPPARVKWMKRAWHGDDLAGACLAIGAIEDDLEATAFVAAAREHGVVVNVIDRPAFCDFFFWNDRQSIAADHWHFHRWCRSRVCTGHPCADRGLVAARAQGLG